MNTTDTSPFQYFTAEFLGWNGSRSRVITSATGCWDDESEAESALDRAIDTAFRKYCDGRGLDPEGEDSQDEFSGTRSDYQRTSVRYLCIPSVDGRLDHTQGQWVSPGELPMLAEAGDFDPDAGSAAPLSGREQDAAGDRYFSR